MFAEGCTLNKPTVLRNGDWLLPVSDWHQKTARVFASTDEGATWKERGSLQFPDWEFDEHMTVELKDGRPMWLHRCEQCMACLQWCPAEAIEFGRSTT